MCNQAAFVIFISRFTLTWKRTTPTALVTHLRSSLCPVSYDCLWKWKHSSPPLHCLLHIQIQVACYTLFNIVTSILPSMFPLDTELLLFHSHHSSNRLLLSHHNVSAFTTRLTGPTPNYKLKCHVNVPGQHFHILWGKHSVTYIRQISYFII